MLLRVHGVGVLLTGPAGSGKSTLALELIARGHALIADDVVELRRDGGALTGRAPRLLRGWLATRALGLLDVRALYGPRALRAAQRLDLILRLGRTAAADPLRGARGRRRLLGVTVPTCALRVGHNLPALVEAACLDRRLRRSGIAGDRLFVQRQRKVLEQ